MENNFFQVQVVFNDGAHPWHYDYRTLSEAQKAFELFTDDVKKNANVSEVKLLLPTAE